MLTGNEYPNANACTCCAIGPLLLISGPEEQSLLLAILGANLARCWRTLNFSANGSDSRNRSRSASFRSIGAWMADPGAQDASATKRPGCPPFAPLYCYDYKVAVKLRNGLELCLFAESRVTRHVWQRIFVRGLNVSRGVELAQSSSFKWIEVDRPKISCVVDSIDGRRSYRLNVSDRNKLANCNVWGLLGFICGAVPRGVCVFRP
ncbi:hypothetical protein STENOSP10_01250 [Stenotrophomonas sepilia]|uniref:Uncharacterized protein n=1 Tax=Stenotrophomonas sepilia TaxID=2860290 RepID=A0ABQ6Q8R0_9GAMM|nr:hypothetical protein STENOSP10_01250 [Stenotrophomonas sepilia]